MQSLSKLCLQFWVKSSLALWEEPPRNPSFYWMLTPSLPAGTSRQGRQGTPFISSPITPASGLWRWQRDRALLTCAGLCFLEPQAKQGHISNLFSKDSGGFSDLCWVWLFQSCACFVLPSWSSWSVGCRTTGSTRWLPKEFKTTLNNSDRQVAPLPRTCWPQQRHGCW